MKPRSLYIEAAAALFTGLLAFAMVARADEAVGITGMAHIPGQKCDIDYRIEIVQDPAVPPAARPNTFHLTARMKPHDPNCVPKKFYICMMFQMKEGDAKDDLDIKKRSRVVLDTQTCRDPTGKQVTCWCCRKPAPGDANPDERHAYHLGCREVNFTTKDQWTNIWDGKTEPAVRLAGLKKPVTVADIESIYWDTFLGFDEKTNTTQTWTRTCTAGQACVAVPPANLCPDVVGENTSMGPPTKGQAFTGTKQKGGIYIWAGAMHRFPGWIFDYFRAALPGTSDTVHRGEAVQVMESETASCGQNAKCIAGAVPLGNFVTMGFPGKYPSRLQGIFSGPPGTHVVVYIPGYTIRRYVIGESGKIAIDDHYITDSLSHTNDSMYMVAVTKALAAAQAPMRFDGTVSGDPGNAIWKINEPMHYVTLMESVKLD